MQRVAVLLVLIGSLTGSALAWPVDPNAENGIAVLYSGGGSTYVALCTDGEIYTTNSGLTWVLTSPEQWPRPPIPVADILDWTPRLLIDRDGAIWAFQWDGVGQWIQGGTLPSCSEVVRAEQESLGSVKQMFR
jgi:hypothetical protein